MEPTTTTTLKRSRMDIESRRKLEVVIRRNATSKRMREIVTG